MEYIQNEDEKKLFDYVRTNNIEAVNKLIGNVPKLNLNSTNDLGSTALMIACENKNFEIMKLLIDKNANTNLKDNNGNFALAIFLLRYSDKNIWKTFTEEEIKTVIKLFEITEPNLSTNSGYNSLMIVIDYENTGLVKLFLDKGKDLNLNIQDNDGWTPLMLAVQISNKEIVNLLISKKVDPDIQDNLGWTALMHAIDNANKDMVKILCNRNETKDDLKIINKDFKGADIYKNSYSIYNYFTEDQIRRCPRFSFEDLNETLDMNTFDNSTDATIQSRWRPRTTYNAESLSISRFKCSKLLGEDHIRILNRNYIKNYIQKFIKIDRKEKLSKIEKKRDTKPVVSTTDICPICIEEINIKENCKLFPCCKGRIHEDCLNSYESSLKESKFRCPLCNKELETKDIKNFKNCDNKRAGEELLSEITKKIKKFTELPPPSDGKKKIRKKSSLKKSFRHKSIRKMSSRRKSHRRKKSIHKKSNRRKSKRRNL